ncbi:MAG: tRNA lysidine(34) synthetase TilS [Chitinivibrionales bacterium]
MHPDGICEEVAVFFRSFLPDSPKSVCVAVSGGGDSVALFRVLDSLKERLRIGRLAVVHVNHRLRGSESDADALFVKNLARDAGADFFMKELEKPQGIAGLEEWGRRERYAFFSRVRETERFTFIATGHTADDQAETVLMRLMRGCGLKGLRSLLPVREDGVIRPLLTVPRESLRDWLAEREIGFREDSSNTDLRFKRNWIRSEVLPAIVAKSPDAVNRIARTADHARTAWNALRPIIDAWTESNVTRENKGRYAVSKSGLVGTAIAEEAIAEFFRDKEIPFERRHITALFSNASRTNGTFLLPGGWRYSCAGDIVEFFKGNNSLKARTPNKNGPVERFEIAVPGTTVCENEKLLFEVIKFETTDKTAFSFSKDNWTVYLNAALITGPMVFRSIRPDDIFRPLGSDGFRNVAMFLKKRKIPGNGPAGKGVVVNKNDEIIWLPGIRISHFFRLTSQTKAVVKISCKSIRICV